MLYNIDSSLYRNFPVGTRAIVAGGVIYIPDNKGKRYDPVGRFADTTQARTCLTDAGWNYTGEVRTGEQVSYHYRLDYRNPS